jgi:hypothetical protein
MALKQSMALCYREWMRWFLALALACAVAAHAQPGRLLPAGKLGELNGGGQAFPLVRIGSEVLRLSPGALVYDQSNRTIVHGNLPESANVLYVQEPGGDVSRMYILRPDELERLRREAKR